MAKSKNLELLAHGINFEEKNLFDNIYPQKRNSGLIIEEVNRLKIDTEKNFLKIGRNLLEILNDHTTKEHIIWALEQNKTDLKFTQAFKYMEAYNYCNRKFQLNLSTEESMKLGIEKLYLLTRLEDETKQEKLERFVLDKNLTVKQLQKLVEILNNKNNEIKLAQEFEEKYVQAAQSSIEHITSEETVPK